MAYEVIFSPKVENARKPRLTPIRAKETLNKQQIEEKMKAAEKRRKVKISSYFNSKLMNQIIRLLSLYYVIS